MNRTMSLLVLSSLLSAAPLEARGRGNASAGDGVAPIRQPGAIIRHGNGGHGIGRHRGFGFGVGRRGFGVQRSWPLFGWGLGVYSSEYNAPFQSSDYDATRDSENRDSSPVYYYLKPAKPEVTPNCKDTWTTQDSSPSLGNFMTRVFELQCQNRHPEAGANKPQPTTSGKD